MGTTILVTGARGKTARHLIPKLLRRGITVRAGSSSHAPTRAGAEPVPFDWFDESTYRAALTGAEAAYLVSPGLVRGGAEPVAQVEKFMHDAAGFGVRRIVLLSSFGVDQAPPEDALRRVESAVAESGVAHTVLRPTAFMQNFSENHWSGIAGKIRDQGRLIMPFGEHPVSYISAEDIAEVAAVALTEDGHDGKGYALTGPEAITLTEAAASISAAIGRHVPYVDPGPEAIRQILLDGGIPEQFAGYVDQAYRFAITSGVMAATTGDVRAVTGRPATDFADFATTAAGAWIA